MLKTFIFIVMNHLSQAARTVQVVFICSSKQDPPLSCRAQHSVATQDFTLSVIKTIKCNFPSPTSLALLTFAQHFSTFSLHRNGRYWESWAVLSNLLLRGVWAMRGCVRRPELGDARRQGGATYRSSGHSEPSGAGQQSAVCSPLNKYRIFTAFYTLPT